MVETEELSLNKHEEEELALRRNEKKNRWIQCKGNISSMQKSCLKRGSFTMVKPLCSLMCHKFGKSLHSLCKILQLYQTFYHCGVRESWRWTVLLSFKDQQTSSKKVPVMSQFLITPRLAGLMVEMMKVPVCAQKIFHSWDVCTGVKPSGRAVKEL